MSDGVAGAWEPGWYPDGTGPGTRAYWNGQGWTPYRVDGEGFPINKQGKRVRRGKLPKWKLAPEVGAATLRAVMRDRWVILVLLVGSFTTFLISALVGLAFVLAGFASPHASPVINAIAMVVTIAVTVSVTQLYVSVVIAAAWTRAQGGQPTFRSSMAIVWSRRRQLAAWAAVSTVVFIVMKSIEHIRIVGLIAGLVGELAWSVTTMFALPLVVVEGSMPLATLKRSARLLRENFGFGIGYSAGFGLLRMVVVLPVLFLSGGLFVGGVIGVVSSTGAVLLGASLLALLLAAVIFALVVGVSAAFGQYINFAIFRLATEESVPGLDPRLLPPRLPGPVSA